MAIALRGTPVGSNNGSGSGSITVTFPTGHISGDILLICLAAAGGSSTTITTPSGWTRLEAQQNSGTALTSAVYWRVDTGSLGSSVAVTLTSSKASAICFAFSGASIAAPVAAQFSHSVNASSLTVAIATLGTFANSSNGIDVCFGAMSFGGNTTAAPASYTNSATASGGAGATYTQLGSAYLAYSGVTTVASRTETWTGTAAVNIGYHVFIRESWSLSRTGSDSVSSLSDSPSRAGIPHSRTAGDSVGSLSESPVRSALSLIRTAADALASLVESAVRAATTFTRSASDTVGPISDSPSRTLSLTRTASDSLPSLADSAARSALALSRTASDSVPSLSDSPVRAATTFTRSASDAVSTLSESPVRSAIAFARTTADSVSPIAETATRSLSLARTASDSIDSIDETVARTPMSFTRRAADIISGIRDTWTSGGTS
jgi:hypothetical protein